MNDLPLASSSIKVADFGQHLLFSNNLPGDQHCAIRICTHTAVLVVEF